MHPVVVGFNTRPSTGPPPGQYYEFLCDEQQQNCEWLPIGGVAGVTWFDSCLALPTASHVVSTIISENTCNPVDPVPFGEGIDVPPGYGGFFKANDGSMDIEIAGASVTAEYDLATHFALSDCQSGGIDGGTCTLVMSAFDMNLHDIDMSGGSYDYNVTASLSLSANAVAEVFFDECGVSTCEGNFEFSVAEENPLGLDLAWTQVNVANSSTGHGEVHLGNDGESLGGVDTVYGFIQLDLAGSSGVIVMNGYGEDSLGGDFATAEFGLYGWVETIDTEPADCCDTHLTGGCENPYVKVCVAVREPSCVLSEWDASCVTGVDSYGCAVCP